jgi:hypothetical protein
LLLERGGGNPRSGERRRSKMSNPRFEETSHCADAWRRWRRRRRRRRDVQTFCF